MTDPLHPAQLDRLAGAIADRGIEAVEPAITRVVTAARTAGLHSAALDALADRTRTDVLRLRAFAAVHAALAASTATTILTTTEPRRQAA